MRTAWAALLLGGACAGGDAEPSGPAQPDVLLITVDTVRADALGTYGRAPSPSPTLDALASRGVRFDEALATVPFTLPAHASILTGAYPDQHGVRTNDGFALGPAQVTLAERLSEAGYTTGGFVSAGVLDGAFGVGQGFDRFEDEVPAAAGLGVVPAIPAEVVAERAQQWLAGLGGSGAPLFLWVHFYDAHLPHAADPTLLAAAGDPYHAEVARVDRAIGGLLDHLRVLGRDPLVVVVGDHGEGRGDHGEATHGLFVYRSTMRVPLLIAGPGVRAGVEPTPVSQVDIVPTLMDLVGLPDPGVDGRSLGPALRGEPLAARPVFGENWHPRLGFGLGQLTVRQDETERLIDAPRPERYAWRVDPDELRDLGADAAALVELRAFSSRAGSSAPVPARMAPEVEQQLAALGYLGGVAPDDRPLSALPDAKDHREIGQLIDVLRHSVDGLSPDRAAAITGAFVEAYPGVVAARHMWIGQLQAGGHTQAALRALAPLLARSPRDPALLTLRASILTGPSPGSTEARQVLEAVLEEHPGWVPARVELARWHWDAGALKPALAVVESGPEGSADDRGLRTIRGALLGELGREAEAANVLAAVLVEAPEAPQVRFHLARALARIGRAEDALPMARRALAEAPDDPAAQALLGGICFVTGRLAEAAPLLEAAVASGSQGPEPRLILADLESRSGRSARAWAHLSAAEAEGGRTEASDMVRALLSMRDADVAAARRVISATRPGDEAAPLPR